LRDIVKRYQDIAGSFEETAEFLQVMEEDDPEYKDVLVMLQQIYRDLDLLEFESKMDQPDDHRNALLSINSGAGGTEAMDWVAVLFRMYKAWGENNRFNVKVIDEVPGEIAGFKSVTMEINGKYAYGFLRSEIGVHRLVRISPFDSNSRRHTSFASVFLYPEVDKSVEIEINPTDLRIDTFRASGAGGQHVNKTDSAIRITHHPSGIVTQCQSERSQHRNKESAMKLLYARLYQRQLEEERARMDELEGTKAENAWGSQIRSYVLHPYNMIKDHRTGHETSNTTAVLDGDLDGFIQAFLLGDVPGSD
jgi:peptide chain release factor 2